MAHSVIVSATPPWVTQNIADDKPAPPVGLLSLQPFDETTGFAANEVLSPSGDLVEAVAHFFSALRRLDVADLDLIIAKPFPEKGLGRALNDRL